MEVRILQTFGRWQKGSVQNLARPIITNCAKDLGIEPFEFCISTALGQSFLEREPVEVREISVGDRQAIPELKADLVATEDLEQARKKLNKAKSELLQSEAEYREKISLFSLTGVSAIQAEKIQELIALIQRRRRRFSERSAELAKLEALFSFENYSTEDDERNEKIRELAVKVGQFPDLLGELLLLREDDLGSVLPCFGPRAYNLTQALVKELKARYPREALNALWQKESIAFLKDWAEDRAQNGEEIEPQEIPEPVESPEIEEPEVPQAPEIPEEIEVEDGEIPRGDPAVLFGDV